MMGREQWTYVDELNKPPRLRRGDACFYYLVYTPHAGYGISNANGIVLNYKIPIGGESGLRNRPQRRRYKDAAITKYAEAIVDFIEGKRIRATGEELAAIWVADFDLAYPLPPGVPRLSLQGPFRTHSNLTFVRWVPAFQGRFCRTSRVLLSGMVPGTLRLVPRPVATAR